MDWNNLQTWQYFALGGAAVLVLGLILYFLPVGKMKIPGGVTAAVGGLATGLALGILFMASYGYKPSRPETAAEGAASDGAPVQMPGAGGPKMMGGGGKGGGGKGGGGPKAPNPRTQLAALVTALDRLADRPVTIRLTPEQRAVLAEQLKGLDTADAI